MQCRLEAEGQLMQKPLAVTRIGQFGADIIFNRPIEDAQLALYLQLLEQIARRRELRFQHRSQRWRQVLAESRAGALQRLPAPQCEQIAQACEHLLILRAPGITQHKGVKPAGKGEKEPYTQGRRGPIAHKGQRRTALAHAANPRAEPAPAPARRPGHRAIPHR